MIQITQDYEMKISDHLNKPSVLNEACSDSIHESNGDNVMSVSLALTLFTAAFGLAMTFGFITCISRLKRISTEEELQ